MGPPNQKMGATCGYVLELSLSRPQWSARQRAANLEKLRQTLFPGFVPRSSSCPRRHLSKYESPGLNPNTKQVGLQVSQEWKGHLQYLGKGRDSQVAGTLSTGEAGGGQGWRVMLTLQR